MPVDSYDGREKDGSTAEGRGQSRGGQDSRGGDKDLSRRDDYAAGRDSGKPRRPDSLPPPPGHGGSGAGRSHSRGHVHPRSSHDRDRNDRERSEGYAAEGRENSQSRSDRQQRDRDRDKDRDRARERDRERLDYPARDAEQPRSGGDLRDHLNHLRGKEGTSRDRSPYRRTDQLNGSQARTPPPGPGARPAGSGTSKFLVEELRKVGQSLLVNRPTPEPRSNQTSPTRSGLGPSAPPRARASSQHQRRMQDSRSASDDDMEAGEIRSDGEGDAGIGEAGASGRKRRGSRSPSDPPPPASKAARTAASGGVGQGLLSRVFDDVQSFRLQQAELDIDPDAPVALKSSPSGSEDGEHELDVKYRRQLEAAQANRTDSPGAQSAGSGDEGDGGMGGAGVKSRWLIDADAAPENNGGAAGPSGRGVSTSREGSPSSSDDERNGGRSDSLPPSPRTLLNRSYNMLQECRGVDEFEKISRISEGTYGVVYKAREKKTGKLVALKMIKMEKEKEGFPVTSIREINVLLNFHHPNIVHVSEIVVNHARSDQVFMVMELMDHDLRSIVEPAKGKEIRMTRPFSVGDIKNLMLQLLLGISYLHNNWVLHRDLKTSNILYNSKGELKICDFGLARQYGSPLKPYTHMVVTLWYRAPELLFGTKIYSTAIDMWSVGCIMGELLLGTALLPGQGEFEQIDKIVHLLGTPNEEVWPGLKDLPNYGKIVLKQVPSQLRSKFQTSYGGGAMVTEAGFDLLSQLLAWDPEKRISADDAMEHRWFKETPLPQKQELLPTFAPR